MLSNSNNTAPSIGTIAKRYITTGLFGLDAEGIYRMFFNTQLQALYAIVPNVIRAEMIYFFLNTNILVSLPVTNDSLAKDDELEQVMKTIISLGYILSHYNQKGGANVCIVLGK
jgi:hypothetical protein